MAKVIDIKTGKKNEALNEGVPDYNPHWRERAIGQIELLGTVTSSLMHDFDEAGHPELKKLNHRLMNILTDMAEVKVRLIKIGKQS